MDARRRQRGSLERGGGPALPGRLDRLPPGQGRQLIGAQLAYTTVMTVLTRLAGKGLVQRTRAGRGYVYRAVADSAEVTARQMGRLLEKAQDRGAVLARFVRTLAPDDERLLIELL